MIQSLAASVFKTPIYFHAGDWAEKNRKLSRSESSEPGMFNFRRAPYLIPIYEAAESGQFSKIIIVCASQMGKTEFVLNRIAYRLDTNPAPILIALPNKDLAHRYSRKRISKMLRNTPSLSAKMNWSTDDNIYEKYVAGTSIRLAWCTSASQLCSDPFAEAHIDELDRCDEDVEGEGDPVSLIQARGATFPDFLLIINSTPTIENDSPIEREENQASIQAVFSWKCPKCLQYFAPKFENLKWKEKSKKEEALENAWVECPKCEGKIEDKNREEMNLGGKFLSKKDGGELNFSPSNRSISFRISGLCSPWKTFGERAAAFLEAKESGSAEKIQGVINTAFGESWKVSGEAPKWEEIWGLREEYKILPDKILCLTAGIDVQKDRIYFIIRAWGSEMESWLVSFGEIWGDTEKETVWKEIYSRILCSRWGEKKLPIRFALIDSAYRSYVVYEFCRKYPEVVSAAKGFPSSNAPVNATKIEYGKDGSALKFSTRLFHIDDGYFKEWVHGRIKRAKTEKNVWHINLDVNEDYCKHLVAEQLIIKPSGRKKWIQVAARNDYLDCEKLATAAAYSLGLYLPAQKEKQREVLSEGINVWR